MSTPVQAIYSQVAADLLEDAGLTLGIITDQEFIDQLNLTLIDVLREAPLYLLFFSTQLLEGVSVYGFPDGLQRVDDCFVSGNLLEPAPYSSLTRQYRQWAYQVGQPQFWNQEQIPNRTIQILPVPDTNSTGIPDQFAPPALVDNGDNPTTMANSGVITMLGPQLPATITALNQAVPLLAPDFALTVLAFGVLQRIFRSDSELRDDGRAEWCGQQYQLLLSLLKIIMDEPGE